MQWKRKLGIKKKMAPWFKSYLQCNVCRDRRAKMVAHILARRVVSLDTSLQIYKEKKNGSKNKREPAK